MNVTWYVHDEIAQVLPPVPFSFWTYSNKQKKTSSIVLYPFLAPGPAEVRFLLLLPAAHLYLRVIFFTYYAPTPPNPPFLTREQKKIVKATKRR